MLEPPSCGWWENTAQEFLSLPRMSSGGKTNSTFLYPLLLYFFTCPIEQTWPVIVLSFEFFYKNVFGFSFIVVLLLTGNELTYGRPVRYVILIALNKESPQGAWPRFEPGI